MERAIWATRLILVIFVVIIGYWIISAGNAGYSLITAYSKGDSEYITVTKGSITEIVSVTGNTKPIENITLGFQNSGIVSRVYYNLGDTVNAGDVIASLDTSSLSVALRQAWAAVEIQKAQLDNLMAGTQPENIATTETSLASAEDDLAETIKNQEVLVSNAYQSLLNSTITAQSQNKSSTVPPPIISGVYTKNNPGVLNIQIYSTGSGGAFSLSGLSGGTGILQSTRIDSTTITTPVALGDTGLFMQLPSANYSLSSGNSTSLDLLNYNALGINVVSQGTTNNYDNTAWTITIPNTAALNYLLNYNAYQQALQNKSKSIALAQAQVDRMRAELKLKQAGSTSQIIAAQRAGVRQAQASVSGVQVNLQNSKIIAPISGILTQQDAKIGQQVIPGVPLVSIIGSGGFEIEVGISEVDVGKLLIGNKVTMTFDAFPNETFDGTVSYIAPAETNKQGVITYLTKISFDKADPRLKSGLTANLNIITKHKDNVLILPQSAIVLNDQGKFVEVLENNKTKRIPVTIGIQDQNGNVEIISGVTENQQVLNVGLKKND